MNQNLCTENKNLTIKLTCFLNNHIIDPSKLFRLSNNSLSLQAPPPFNVLV